MKFGGQFLIGYIPVTCIHYAYCVSSWQLSGVRKVDKYTDDFPDNYGVIIYQIPKNLYNSAFYATLGSH